MSLSATETSQRSRSGAVPAIYRAFCVDDAVDDRDSYRGMCIPTTRTPKTGSELQPTAQTRCLTRYLPWRSDTPLHIAAIEAEMTVLQLLICSKASMQIKNVVGYKACVFSSSRGPWAVTPRRRL